MPIQDLSVELMEHILGYCAESDLLSVLLTCQGLKGLIEPLLYENIDFSIRRGPKINHYSSILKQPFQLLLRSLLHRPSLGIHVKRLTLPTRESWGDFKFAPIDLQAAARRGSEVTPTKNEQWIGALKEECTAPLYRQAVLVLLLSYFDNLQSLTLLADPCHVSEEMGTSILRKIGKASLFALALSKLQELKEVAYLADFIPNIERGPISYRSALIQTIYSLPRIELLTLTVGYSSNGGTGDYQPRLPNISHFSLSGNTSYATTTEASLIDLVTPTVKTLRLVECQVEEKAIGSLLNWSPKITSLELGLLGNCVEPVPFSFLDCTELGAQIGHQSRKRHLEHLTISVDFYDEGAGFPELGGPFGVPGLNPYRWGLKGSIGDSFKDFTALKTLEIDLPVLLGWYPDRAKSLAEVLPSSLEELRIQTNFDDWDSCLWRLPVIINLIKGYLGGGVTGNLRNIIYFSDSYSNLLYKEILDDCKKLCMESRIRFHSLEYW